MDSDDTFAFLKARDPSIIAGCLAYPRKITQKKMYSLFNKTPEITQMEILENDEAEHLRIFLRLKPVHNMNKAKNYKIDNDHCLVCHVPEGSQCLKNVKEGDTVIKRFTFDKIFDSNVLQTDLFNQCVKPQILDFMNGENATIMSYGTTGSGKTYTMLGTSAQPGIIPRSLEYIFKSLPSLSKYPTVKPLSVSGILYLNETSSYREAEVRNKLLNTTKSVQDNSVYKTMQEKIDRDSNAYIPHAENIVFSVWISFLEIYNENIYDLLVIDSEKDKRKKLKIAEDKDGNTYVKDLTCLSVTSGQEAFELLQFGKHNLNYAVTSVNDHSSRSHSIFIIKLLQSNKTNSKTQLSHFSFCDLAGSERVKKTCNVGDRLKESNNINTSLHVLGRCLKSVRDLQHNKNHQLSVIPYRDSKLTRLFKRPLFGNEYISILVNINPDPRFFDETQHVLNFSAVAKDIIIEPIRKEIKAIKETRFSHYLQNRQPSSSIKIPNNTISSINEETTVESLNKKLEYFQNLCLHQEEVIRKNESLKRKEMSELYDRIEKRIESVWRDRLKEEEESLKLDYEKQIAELKQSYENRKVSNKRSRNSWDSDDDVVEDYKANYEYLNKEYLILKSRYQNLESVYNNQVKELTSVNDKLMIELEHLRNNNLVEQITDRDEILKDAAQVHTELLQELELCKKECDLEKAKTLKLNEKCDYLQTRLEEILETKCLLEEQNEELENSLMNKSEL